VSFFFEFRLLVVSLELILLITFFVRDLFSFYFFFEFSILPTIIIIIGWGYQPERLQASIYFFFYTLVGSIPLLLLILRFKGKSFIFYERTVSLRSRIFLVRFFILSGLTAFLIKIPIFFVHLWLPKAHVEAPVAGSIILAAVLLKLGGYGIIRVINFLIFYFIKVRIYIYRLGLLRIIFVGAICCRLNDIKALVAYSSVAHIAMVICGCVSLTKWGLIGAFIILIAHGLRSSGLFCIVNIYYERSLRRRIYLNKGLIILFPLFTFLVFFALRSKYCCSPLY